MPRQSNPRGPRDRTTKGGLESDLIRYVRLLRTVQRRMGPGNPEFSRQFGTLTMTLLAKWQSKYPELGELLETSETTLEL